jgi:hypothetical protein
LKLILPTQCSLKGLDRSANLLSALQGKWFGGSSRHTLRLHLQAWIKAQQEVITLKSLLNFAIAETKMPSSVIKKIIIKNQITSLFVFLNDGIVTKQDQCHPQLSIKINGKDLSLNINARKEEKVKKPKVDVLGFKNFNASPVSNMFGDESAVLDVTCLPPSPAVSDSGHASARSEVTYPPVSHRGFFRSSFV